MFGEKKIRTLFKVSHPHLFLKLQVRRRTSTSVWSLRSCRYTDSKHRDANGCITAKPYLCTIDPERTKTKAGAPATPHLFMKREFKPQTIAIPHLGECCTNGSAALAFHQGRRAQRLVSERVPAIAELSSPIGRVEAPAVRRGTTEASSPRSCDDGRCALH